MDIKNIFRKTVGVLTAAVIVMSSAVFSSSAEKRQKLPSNDAMSVVDAMGAGWNLGNAFDASDCTWVTDELAYESAWCGAKTTKKLIRTVRAAGFSTIRVPVSWHNHVDADFNISETWMKRVREVIDWCMDEDLYVIINVHHDVAKGAYYPSASEYAVSEKYMKKIWSQICDTFGDYSDHLIFEAINEPRPTEGTNPWWYDANNITDEYKDYLESINKLNQVFVDTVRASGKKNAKRFILVGGFATAGDNRGVLSPMFELPKDSAKNRLIADVHYYGIGARSSLEFLDKLYESYTSKGIPISITEYGLNENGYKYFDNTDIAATRMSEFFSYARARGISVILWDNNWGKKGVDNCHKFIDRATEKVVLPKIVNTVVDAGAPALIKSYSDAVTVHASASSSAVKLTWNKVGKAQKYAVYQYKNGKFVLISDKVTKTSATVKGLKSGKTLKFAVCVCVNGKWTKPSKDNMITVKTK